MGGWCVFNLAPSEWSQHMPKSRLAKTNVGKIPKEEDKVVEQHTPVAPNEMHAHQADSGPNPAREAAHDQATLQFLDQLLAGHNPDEVLENDDNELVDTKADLQDMDAGTAGFTNYIKE